MTSACPCIATTVRLNCVVHWFSNALELFYCSSVTDVVIHMHSYTASSENCCVPVGVNVLVANLLLHTIPSPSYRTIFTILTLTLIQPSQDSLLNFA